MNVTKKGIFQGSGDGFFNPEKDMTRAEFAGIMIRYCKLYKIVPIL